MGSTVDFGDGEEEGVGEEFGEDDGLSRVIVDASGLGTPENFLLIKYPATRTIAKDNMRMAIFLFTMF